MLMSLILLFIVTSVFVSQNNIKDKEVKKLIKDYAKLTDNDEELVRNVGKKRIVTKKCYPPILII